MSCSIGSHLKLNYHAGKNRSVVKIDSDELTLMEIELLKIIVSIIKIGTLELGIMFQLKTLLWMLSVFIQKGQLPFFSRWNDIC